MGSHCHAGHYGIELNVDGHPFNHSTILLCTRDWQRPERTFWWERLWWSGSLGLGTHLLCGFHDYHEHHNHNQENNRYHHTHANAIANTGPNSGTNPSANAGASEL